MSSHDPRALLGAACLLAGATIAGCSESAPPTVAMPTAAPTRTQAPAPPPRPPVTSVADLMTELGIDERVSMAEADAPGTDVERRAVLEFFDSFARGDSTALGSMLSRLDADELDALVETGAWEATTKYVSNIKVQCGISPQGEACTLAVFYFDHEYQGDDFQPQLWYYTTDDDDMDRRFDAVEAPPNLMDRLYGDDWIARWFNILEEELALADEPDEEIVIPQRDMSDTTRSSGSSPSAIPTSPNSPAPGNKPGPGGPGRRPKKGKRPAPGKG